MAIVSTGVSNTIRTPVEIVDGQPTTTTRDIAAAFDKQHDDVLRTVRQRMAESGEWGIRNFTDTPHVNSQNGQTYSVIRMTEKGFMFVVQKFTGKKAVRVQLAFVDEFERMRNALANPNLPALENRTLSPEVEKAILDKSFQLGSEAHELARKHLRALVSDQIATSKEAIRQIQATTLAQALGKNTVPTKVYEELMVAFHASRTIHTVMAGVVENIQRMENSL